MPCIQLHVQEYQEKNKKAKELPVDFKEQQWMLNVIVSNIALAVMLQISQAIHCIMVAFYVKKYGYKDWSEHAKRICCCNLQEKDYQGKTQKGKAKQICIRPRRTAVNAIAINIALAVMLPFHKSSGAKLHLLGCV